MCEIELPASAAQMTEPHENHQIIFSDQFSFFGRVYQHSTIFNSKSLRTSSILSGSFFPCRICPCQNAEGRTKNNSYSEFMLRVARSFYDFNIFSFLSIQLVIYKMENKAEKRNALSLTERKWNEK